MVYGMDMVNSTVIWLVAIDTFENQLTSPILITRVGSSLRSLLNRSRGIIILFWKISFVLHFDCLLFLSTSSDSESVSFSRMYKY